MPTAGDASNMTSVILRRLVSVVPILLLVSMVSFALMAGPGRSLSRDRWTLRHARSGGGDPCPTPTMPRPASA